VLAHAWMNRKQLQLLACNSQYLSLLIGRRGTSSPKDMITDMSVELQPFSPGEQPEQPSPEELEEDIAGNDKLAPMLDKLKDFENFVGKLSGGEKQWLVTPPGLWPTSTSVCATVEMYSMQCAARVSL
jgi:hypothetical protein